MRPIVLPTFKSSEQEIAEFNQKRREWEAELGRPNEYLPSSDLYEVSPRKKAVKPKWRATPTEVNKRPDEWLGGGCVTKKKRSWKVKECPVLDLDGEDISTSEL